MSEHWDFFICHASEDKEEVVEPLAHELRERGFRVWYDRRVLRVGDRLRRTIQDGLSRSRHGIVVLSPSFFQKHWPQEELDGLTQREVDGRKVILPVWHRVTHQDIVAYSPTLADRLAATTSEGIPRLAESLVDAVSASPAGSATPTWPWPARVVQAADVTFGYEELTISSRLHRYALTARLTLNIPPDQGRFRLVLFWPQRIRIAGMENLTEGEEQRIEGEVYRELTLDGEKRIFPGQTMKIIGPRALASLHYEYDDEIWSRLHGRLASLRYSLHLEDHLAVGGGVPFSALNSY